MIRKSAIVLVGSRRRVYYPSVSMLVRLLVVGSPISGRCVHDRPMSAMRMCPMAVSVVLVGRMLVM